MKYERGTCITFRKTAEAFGGFSNMAGGFPLVVNGTHVRTSEALYQAMRWPHMPQVQQLVIEQLSPMSAKMKGKPFRDQSRADWDEVRVEIMRWCLHVKLALHWASFGGLLLRTGDRPIVEDSRKDSFWGAIPQRDDPDVLVGTNMLGQLLVEARARAGGERLRRVELVGIPNLLLLGAQIGAIEVV